MAEFPTLARMPGSDSAFASDDFSPAEIAGMQNAGWILIATAAFLGLTWVLSRTSIPPIPAVIDVFLGVQLLRLRHSWRAWALVRAGLGLLLSAVVMIGALIGLGEAGSLNSAMVGFGQVAYCSSLVLLLTGIPTERRVLIGRAAFVMSILIPFVGGVILGFLRIT